MTVPEPLCCPATGHQMVGLFLYHCPHRGAMVLHVQTGSCEDPISGREVHFGPFDSDLDVKVEVLAELDHWYQRAKPG